MRNENWSTTADTAQNGNVTRNALKNASRSAKKLIEKENQEICQNTKDMLEIMKDKNTVMTQGLFLCRMLQEKQSPCLTGLDLPDLCGKNIQFWTDEQCDKVGARLGRQKNGSAERYSRIGEMNWKDVLKPRGVCAINRCQLLFITVALKMTRDETDKALMLFHMEPLCSRSPLDLTVMLLREKLGENSEMFTWGLVVDILRMYEEKKGTETFFAAAVHENAQNQDGTAQIGQKTDKLKLSSAENADQVKNEIVDCLLSVQDQLVEIRKIQNNGIIKVEPCASLTEALTLADFLRALSVLYPEKFPEAIENANTVIPEERTNRFRDTPDFYPHIDETQAEKKWKKYKKTSDLSEEELKAKQEAFFREAEQEEKEQEEKRKAARQNLFEDINHWDTGKTPEKYELKSPYRDVIAAAFQRIGRFQRNMTAAKAWREGDAPADRYVSPLAEQLTEISVHLWEHILGTLWPILSQNEREGQGNFPARMLTHNDVMLLAWFLVYGCAALEEDEWSEKRKTMEEIVGQSGFGSELPQLLDKLEAIRAHLSALDLTSENSIRKAMRALQEMYKRILETFNVGEVTKFTPVYLGNPMDKFAVVSLLSGSSEEIATYVLNPDVLAYDLKNPDL